MPIHNENNNENALRSEIEDALETLSKDFKISASYLKWSDHAKVPAVLRFSFKRAYQDVGMSDKNHELTDFGRAVFKHLDEQYEQTGEPKKWELPKVVSMMSYD